jgi:RNA polymerase sigma factor (sigma-70 family)
MSPPRDLARRQAFVEGLYRLHGEGLERFLRRQGLSPDEAADIAQEAFCRLQQVSEVDSIEFPKAFLFRVAANLALDAAKHRKHVLGNGVVDASRLEGELGTEVPGPFRILKGRQELDIARAALEELSPKCRKAFAMHRFESATYAQIAESLDISISMVEKYISQALAHVRLKLHLATQRALTPEKPRQS